MLELRRWGGGGPSSCPQCGARGRCYLLNGVRRTRTGAPTARRVWKCGACRRQFSVLTGTVLEGTRLPLRAWIGCVDEWAACGRLPATAAVAERYGIALAAARHLRRRLEAAAARVPLAARPDPLAALLSMPSADAQRIRQETPTRRRPRPQHGPSADYGDS